MTSEEIGLALERGRLRVVIATVIINVVVVSLLTFAPWSDWRTGVALNIVDNCLLVSFVLAKRDALLARFLLFGLVVGFTELAADAWLVDYTHTLDYSIGGGPMIWRSPFWMPLAWEVLAVQFGYIGLRLCSLEACGAVQSARPLLPESLAAYQSSLATLLPFLLQTGWSGRPNAKSLSRTRGLVSTTQTGSGFKISQRKIRHLEGG